MGQLLKTSTAVVAFLLCAISSRANAGMLTFDETEFGFVHGSVVSLPQLIGTSNPLVSLGIKVSATNTRMPNDIGYAIIYDSNKDGADPDLQRPWKHRNKVGNIDKDEDLRNLLILAENVDDLTPTDGVVDSPDDEGGRPAGSITFEFATAITQIGFDLIDIEGNAELLNNRGFVAAIYSNGDQVGSVGFGDFIDEDSPFFDSTVRYGNNTANRIKPILASQFGNVSSFNKVVFDFGGSGAIDNLNWTSLPSPNDPSTSPVPAPPAYALLISFAGFALIIRRQNWLQVCQTS